MQYKNILPVAILFIVITCFAMHKKLNNNTRSKTWVVSQNSSLSVNGSTNINKFSCVIPAYDHTDTITISKKDEGYILTGDIALSISSFDCHNSGMTRQLQKTLNEKQFPLLHIRFLSLNQLPEPIAKPEFITGLVAIEIAGVAKHFEIKYQISQDDQKVIHLLGSRDLNFSDFNLTPPQKLGGMIKTKDQLTVAFNLNMKSL